MGKITLRHAIGSAASLVEELTENKVYVKVIVYIMILVCLYC